MTMWDASNSGFVYQMGPIDWWPGWAALEEAVAQHGGDQQTQDRVRAELQRICEHAFSEFRKRSYWEGDIVTGPVYAGLPPADGNADGDVMVGIKQSNNGSVFVWSPYQLPWLSEYSV